MTTAPWRLTGLDIVIVEIITLIKGSSSCLGNLNVKHFAKNVLESPFSLYIVGLSILVNPPQPIEDLRRTVFQLYQKVFKALFGVAFQDVLRLGGNAENQISNRIKLRM